VKAALLLTGLLAPWAISAALSALLGGSPRLAGRLTAAAGGMSLGAAAAIWIVVLGGDVLVAGPGDLFRADALSALVAGCIAAVSGLAMLPWAGIGTDQADRGRARVFRIFGSLFTLAMLVAVTINNVALMWVAIEATTIVSAILIPLHRSKASVEASWKYILIGSVGIALAFAGTVLAYFDFVSLLGRRHDALNWTLLMDVAPTLHPDVLRLAFVFLLVGYGTKAGLAPMHTWLPDAHSEAPAPLSAMMSGVLLAVAQYAIIRWKAVVDAAGGPAFTNQVLMALGLLSIGIGALSLVRQHNYKRLLAYSSVEHSGLICLGLTFGPAGVFASLLHLLNHALAKSMSFLLAGRVLARYTSAEVDRVSGLVRTMPATGPLFAAGVLALMGLPPFGLFLSEFLLFRAGFTSGHPVATSAAMLLAGVGFVGLAGHLARMLHGPAPDGVAAGEREWWMLAPLAVSLVAMIALGLLLPDTVARLLGRIAETISI
jgi:hydrogenase-4 component F